MLMSLKVPNKKNVSIYRRNGNGATYFHKTNFRNIEFLKLNRWMIKLRVRIQKCLYVKAELNRVFLKHYVISMSMTVSNTRIKKIIKNQ